MNRALGMIAQGTRHQTLENLRSAFSRGGRESSHDLTPLIVIFGACAITVLACLVVRHIRNSAGHAAAARSAQIYMSCLERLGVGFLDRQLLRLAARQCPHEHPAVMLFNPVLLDECTERWIDRLPLWSLRPMLQRRLRVACARVFREDGGLEGP